MVALQIITLYRVTLLVDLSCDNYVQFLLCSESCGVPPLFTGPGGPLRPRGAGDALAGPGGARPVGLVRQPGCWTRSRFRGAGGRRREASGDCRLGWAAAGGTQARARLRAVSPALARVSAGSPRRPPAEPVTPGWALHPVP